MTRTFSSRLFTLSAWIGIGCGAAFGVSPPGVLARDFQRGVGYAHIHRKGHGYGSEVSVRELKYLMALGVTWIAVTPFGYQSSMTAEDIIGFPGHEGTSEFFKGHDPTLTNDNLKKEIQTAHALGLQVALKPHLWSHDFWQSGNWQGKIQQTSLKAHARWWRSYQDFVLHEARLAQDVQADLFCVGTELVQMTAAYPEEWRALIGEVRQVYRGPVTYAAHFNTEFSGISFWDALDFIGVNAYFPLDVPDGASVMEIAQAWRPHIARLERVQVRVGRPVLFMEIGYPAVKGGHREPWTYAQGPVDDDDQARSYEAMFEAFRGISWLKGAYFWKDFADPALAESRGDGTSFVFRGRPAEAVLHRWYKQ